MNHQAAAVIPVSQTRSVGVAMPDHQKRAEPGPFTRLTCSISSGSSTALDSTSARYPTARSPRPVAVL
jgi:hypothetical protein